MEIRTINLDTPDVTRTAARSCAGTLTRVCGTLEIEANGAWMPYRVAVSEIDSGDRFANGSPVGYCDLVLSHAGVIVLAVRLRQGVETFERHGEIVSEDNEHDAVVAQFLRDLRDEILAGVDNLPIAA